jgi:hypothetical protein
VINLGASFFATRFFVGNLKNAALRLSPVGYSNLKIFLVNAGMIKVFSYRRPAIAS